MEKLIAKKKRAALCLILVASTLATGCIPMLKLPKEVQRQRDIEYARVENQSLKLDLYTPKHPSGKLPVLVWIHGGSWNSGNKNFCPIGFMATQDVAVVSIDYRLDSVAIFPAQLHDCKGAMRWLRANAAKYNLDAEHMGIFGVSAGGHLAALLGTTGDVPSLEGDVGGNLDFSSRVQAVCAFYPPTDLNRLVSDPRTRKNPNGLVARLIGGAVELNIPKAIAASPITYVSTNTTPFYLLHGEKDVLVPVEQSELFYYALKKTGVEACLMVVPGKGHGIIAPPEPAREIYRFFQRHLHDGR